MLSELKSAFKETAAYLFMALKALYFWRAESPIVSVAELVRYVDTRSKFVAQTTLFGYIKTRAGTRYVTLYEDETFTRSANIAKWEIWLACLCDLATYSVAGIGRRVGARPDELEALAVHIVETVLADEEIPAERPQGFEDIRDAYVARAHATHWHQIEPGEGPLAGSLDALIKWAPIADELKILDKEIVRNSMRFKWKKVRDQFEKVVDADAVMADWRYGGGRAAPGQEAEAG